MGLQILVSSDIELIGYIAVDRLLVLRRTNTPSAHAVYIGSGKEPIEDSFASESDRPANVTGPFGLIGARHERVITLQGGEELVQVTPATGSGVHYTYQGTRIFPLPAAHFSYYAEAQERLCVYRKTREVKYNGQAADAGANTRLLVTGVQGVGDWYNSVEIFAASYTSVETNRLMVTNIQTTRNGFTAETEHGTLQYTQHRTFRRVWLEVNWNGTALTEYTPTRQRTIRDEDGLVLT